MRLELAGNPCLSCGPGASLSATQRASILASWRALCGEDGGATFCATLLGGAFEAVPEMRALAGLEPVPEVPVPEAVPEAATNAEDAQALAELVLEVAELEKVVAARDAEIAQLKRADELELPRGWHSAIEPKQSTPD